MWAIAIFIVVLVICVLAYIGYHNRNKVSIIIKMYTEVFINILFYVAIIIIIDPRVAWREEGECS